MLRIAKSTRGFTRFTQVRANHHAAEGAAEPLTPYVKWTAAVLAGVGIVTYDRFYTDGAITKMVTPASKQAENLKESEHYVDFQRREQDRAIALFAPRERSVATENFKPQPVPVSGPRSAHLNDHIDADKITERRPRTDPFSNK
ncbi:hypothetical protein B9G98_00241 [Wickerhamiella sorbophila]|uniref:Uncharacterized protein n=1 Tax=Wickerhamiella sorbophila TaxID=45607 RepID=A0A2T0FCB4_9ASCO|nr:hypothetical protein B9G98_00241 [Wickerhamiella sorbophila]PRT52621.1 hypothetical protein B9G98_00241 [Wickerhamiella sorbophila]